MSRKTHTTIDFYIVDKEKIQNYIKDNDIKGGMANFLTSLFNEHTAEKLTTPSGVVGTFNELLTLYRANKLTKKADMNYILNLMATKELTR
jgi:hypothetical protein